MSRWTCVVRAGVSIQTNTLTVCGPVKSGVVASEPMSDFLRDYLTVVWFGAIALLLAGLLLGVSALVRPNKPVGAEADPVRERRQPGRRRLVAEPDPLLHLRPAVRRVRRGSRVHLPVGDELERYAGFGLVEMGIFVFVLLLGLVYAWRKGVLRWV